MRTISSLVVRVHAALEVKYGNPKVFARYLSTENQSASQAPSTESSTSSGSSGASTAAESPTRSFFSFDKVSDTPVTTPVRRRPYNVEAKLRLQEYRRQAQRQQREMELEEERRTFKLDKSQHYQKGHPDTMQGVVKEIIDIGYILTLPTGREGLLAAMHLGCSGGVELLSRLYSIGEEIPVRVIRVPNPAGKDRCYVRPVGVMPPGVS